MVGVLHFEVAHTMDHLLIVFLLPSPSDAVAFRSARYGRTNGRINMNNVQCSGNEASLLECDYVGFTVFDSHNEDAGVRCFEESNFTNSQCIVNKSCNPAQHMRVYITNIYIYIYIFPPPQPIVNLVALDWWTEPLMRRED